MIERLHDLLLQQQGVPILLLVQLSAEAEDYCIHLTHCRMRM